ncbi:MAG: bacteriohemerythrin [Pseudodesulfovibrio sp.]
MPQIDWIDALDIGLPTIDEQHKHLISLSNSLIQAMCNGMGSDVLEDLFKELRDYTCTHFAEEEVYMESIDYPQIEAQKAAHIQLTKDVDQFREKLLGGTTVSPNEALDFINSWMVNHIKTMDAHIGVYAKTL